MKDRRQSLIRVGLVLALVFVVLGINWITDLISDYFWKNYRLPEAFRAGESITLDVGDTRSFYVRNMYKAGITLQIEDVSIVDQAAEGDFTAINEGSTKIYAVHNGRILGSITLISQKVETEGIYFDECPHSILTGEYITPVISIEPNNATNTETYFTVSDESVLSVLDSSTILAVGEGIAELTVCQDNVEYDSVEIEVISIPTSVS